MTTITRPDTHIRVTSIVDTPKGRGAVTYLDFAKDRIFVQLYGAPVVPRTVQVPGIKPHVAVIGAWEETSFAFDEVTLVQRARPAGQIDEDGLEKFMAAHHSPKKRSAPARRRATLPRPVSFDGDKLAAGEIVSLPSTDGTFLYTGARSALNGSDVVIQDTRTGQAHFAPRKALVRTGKNHTQVGLF